MAAYFLGVLEISLGNYDSAFGCLDAAYTEDTLIVGTQALPDLVEAAIRTGQRDVAKGAPRRLVDRATATGTPLALGLLARPGPSWSPPPTPARSMRTRCSYSPGPGPLLSSPAPTCSTASGCVASAASERPAISCGEPSGLFDAMGCRCFAERTRVELGATGEHVRKREVGTPEELTPQEAEIAALVSRGHANREIAAQLFVTRNTVEYHLRKVFRKLGVSSAPSSPTRSSTRACRAGRKRCPSRPSTTTPAG